MNINDFDVAINEQIEYCMSLLVSKGDEYDTTNNDRLHAFKTAAVLQHQTPKQALAGMMAKHTVSIYDMCVEDKEYPMEKWTEKITDSINYLLILKAMLTEEDANNGKNKVQ